MHICNTAGGTDTATSLVALDPCAPVHEGEMQVGGLGMAVDVADPVTGESIAHTGMAGEMVVRQPFPSMPCFFWGDKDGSLYRSAYFERFNKIDVWAQHDWLSQNPKTGGYMMHGRSDGVLSAYPSNPYSDLDITNNRQIPQASVSAAAKSTASSKPTLSPNTSPTPSASVEEGLKTPMNKSSYSSS